MCVCCVYVRHDVEQEMCLSVIGSVKRGSTLTEESRSFIKVGEDTDGQARVIESSSRKS